MSSWTYCGLNVPHKSKLYFNLLATVQLNWINKNKLGGDDLKGKEIPIHTNKVNKKEDMWYGLVAEGQHPDFNQNPDFDSQNSNKISTLITIFQ